MNAVVGLILRFFYRLVRILRHGCLAPVEEHYGREVARRNDRDPDLTLTTTIDGEQIIQTYTSSEVSIGRNPDSDLILKDDTVSGRHGRLSFQLNQWWYEDSNRPTAPGWKT